MEPLPDLRPARAPAVPATRPLVAVLPFACPAGDAALDLFAREAADALRDCLSGRPELATIRLSAPFTLLGDRRAGDRCLAFHPKEHPNRMPSFFVDRRAQPNGDHEIHDRERCPPPCFPAAGNAEYLGEFDIAPQAFAVARLKYHRVNGCVWCATEFHTQEVQLEEVWPEFPGPGGGWTAHPDRRPERGAAAD